MQTAAPPRGLKAFLVTPVGRSLLVAATLGVVYGAFVYVTVILAIPAFLILGLAVPIYAGLKRPRYLALSGLVVILLVAPLASAGITEEILTPTPAASSAPYAPFGNGGSVLQSAHVDPFQADANSAFTWSVTVYPQYVTQPSAWVPNLTLYLSTCPGAISNLTTYCPSGFTLFVVHKSFTPAVTNVTNVTIRYTIPTEGIWSWQMALAVENNTTNRTATNTSYVYLQGDPTYNGIEGPVVGSFGTFFVTFLPSLYFYAFVLLGVPFYLGLVFYMILKNRERRRRALLRRIPGPAPGPSEPSAPSAAPGSGTGEPPPGEPGATAKASPPPSPDELSCPQCGAVVYAAEPKCWKCGGALSGGPAAPLRSEP